MLYYICDIDMDVKAYYIIKYCITFVTLIWTSKLIV